MSDGWVFPWEQTSITLLNLFSRKGSYLLTQLPLPQFTFPLLLRPAPHTTYLVPIKFRDLGRVREELGRGFTSGPVTRLYTRGELTCDMKRTYRLDPINEMDSHSPGQCQPVDHSLYGRTRPPNRNSGEQALSGKF